MEERFKRHAQPYAADSRNVLLHGRSGASYGAPIIWMDTGPWLAGAGMGVDRLSFVNHRQT